MKRIVSIGIVVCMIASIFLHVLPVYAAESLRVEKPMVEYMENPIGLGRQDIQFSWRMDAGDVRGVKQSRYNIRVAESEEKLLAGDYVWASGDVDSDQSIAVTYDGPALESGKQYFWNVQVADNNGNTAVSEIATFGMGLLEEDAWDGAQWISNAGGTYGDPDKAVDKQKYSVEATFTITNCNLGLGFAAKDTSNFYLWQINTQEGGVEEAHVWLRPHKWVNGNPALIGEYDITDYLSIEDALNQEHTIRIDVDHGKFTTYIDDVKVLYNKPVKTTSARTEDYLEDTAHPEIGEIVFRSANDKNVNEEFMINEIKIIDSRGIPTLWEDFSTGSNVFTGGVVADGQYVVSGNNKEVKFTQKAANDKVYTFETDLKVGYQAAGPAFGMKDSSHFYMWQLNTFDHGKAYVRPHVWNGGGAAMSPEVDISHVLTVEQAENEFNRMRVEFDNGKLTTYINGVLVDTRTNTTIPEIGKIGFRQSKDSKSTNPEVGLFKTMILKDAGGRCIIYDDFSKSDENYYNGTTITDGVLKADNSGGEVKMRADAPAPPQSNSIPYFRKDFVAKGIEVTRATVYASALGHYEMQLNGEKVGEDFMAPGWTEYDTRVQYQAYDVTHQVRAGADNTLGAMLAPGWYSGNISILGNNRYGNTQALIANLVIEYSDGTKQSIVTDGSWKFYTDGPIVTTDMFDGETYDANKEINGHKYGFAEPGVDSSEWGNVGVMYESAYSAKTQSQTMALTAQIGPTVKKMEVLNPISINVVEGKYIIDMGQNFAGIPVLSLKGEPGTTAKIRYAEMLNTEYGNQNIGNGDGPVGSLYTASLRSAKATDYYTFKSNEKETWEPVFTWHGFRYIEISGVSEAPTLDDIVCYALYSEMENTGSFNTSDALLNQIYSNVIWGQRSNFLCIPTDCPQRDERMGWGGDTMAFAKTGLYNMDSAMFYQKWLQDMRDAQETEGLYQNIAPNPHKHQAGFTGDIIWGSSGVIVPYEVWQKTGDNRVITDMYDSMAKWFVAKSGSLLHSSGYGDWLQPDGTNTNSTLVGTAYYAYQLKIMAEMATAIGKEADAQAYADRFELVKENYIKTYVKANGVVDNGSQAAYVLTLGWDLYNPQDEAQMVENLIKAIDANDGLMSVGFVSVNMLLPTLAKYGYSDYAYSLAMERRFPSWGYSIDQGATTIWERWNSYTKENGFGPVSMNSFNHYTFGSVVSWFYSGILGIDGDYSAPGYKNMIIEPVFDGRLDYAEGSYDSYRGTVATRWDRSGNDLTYTVTVPANTTADIILPAIAENITEGGEVITGTIDGITNVDTQTIGKTKISVGSGTYEFKFVWDATINKNSLKAAIASAEKVIESADDYTADSVAVLTAALEVAREVYESESATQAQINESTNALNSAVAALVRSARYDIKRIIEQAKEKMAIEEDYSTASVADLKDAIKAAEDVLADDGRTEEEYKEQIVKVSAAIEALVPGDNVNLAYLKSVTASSQVSATTFAAKNLTDGRRGGNGEQCWSSDGNLSKDHVEWVQIDLGEVLEFNRFLIFPRSDGAPSGYGFPKDFKIEISDDAQSWTPVIVETNWPYVGTNAQRFTFDTVSAQYIKFTGLSLNANPGDSSTYRMQIAEFEVYHFESVAPVVDKSALEALIDQAGALHEEDYTSETWSDFADALAQAKAVLADEDADQDRVNSAYDHLDAAMQALEKVGGGEEILVSKIKINASGLFTLSVKKTAQIPVTVEPEDATDPSVKWISTNPNIFTIDADGIITPHKQGTATLTAQSSNGLKSTIIVRITA